MLKTILERRLVVFIVCIMILGVGLYSTLTMPIRLYPAIAEPSFNVQAWVDHDVEPDTLEREVVIPIESVTINSPYVSKVHVTTGTKNVDMRVILKDSASKNQQEEVKREVEKVLNSITYNLAGKEIFQFTDADIPVLQISFIPDTIENASVRSELENSVLPALKKIRNVSSVSDDLKMYDNHYVLEIKPSAVKGIQKTGGLVEEIRQIFSSNVVGSVSYNGKQMPVRTEPHPMTLKDFQERKLTDGSRIVDNVAITLRSDSEAVYQQVNGQSYYFVQITIPKGTSEVKVAKEIRNTLENLHENKSTDWEYSYIFDTSLFIGQAVKELVTNILIGGILALLILYFVYRSYRTMLVIGLSIPLCIMMTIISMNWLGFTLNMISLIGLGIGTGMIVDACIVVLDNIFRKLQEGIERMTAIIAGTKEMFTPVLSSVLTTISVFVPIAIMEGIIGAFLIQLGLTIAMALLSSLLVAFIVVPILSNSLIKEKKQEIKPRSNTLSVKFENLVIYCLNRKWRTLFIFKGLLILSIFLLLTVVPRGFLANSEDIFLQISYELEEGIDFELSKELISPTSKKIEMIDGVEEVFIMLSEKQSHIGTLFVKYVDQAERKRDVVDINADINTIFEESIPTTSLRLSMGQDNPGAVSIITVSSSSMDHIMSAVPTIKEELSLYPGVTNVETNLSDNNKSWIVRFSEDKLEQYNLSKSSVEQYLSLILHGVSDVDLNLNNHVVKGKIEFPSYYRNSSEALYTLPLDEQNLITLDNVAEIETLIENSSKVRNNGQYEASITIFHDLESRAQLTPLLVNFMANFPIKEVQLSFGGQDLEQMEAFAMLFKALIISVVSVIFILIVQFNSLRQPFIIFISLLFTVIGVTIGFLVTGRSFDAMAMIGLVMLAGIVVNNAIVLIDSINKRRTEYETLRDAVLSSIRYRIRPILTTTLTTVGGLIPMFIGGTASSGFQTPIATSVIFGLLFSTFITLILIPILYELFEGRKERKMKAKLEKSFKEHLVETV